MKVDKLFQELASKKRLGIIGALGQKPMKFTEISDEFDMTSPEASRHLGRLIDAKLIEKKGDGNYSITFFGEMVLTSISELEFIAEKSEHFLSHDASPIPDHLLERMEDLSDGQIVTGVYKIIDTVDEKLDEIEDYLFYMTDDIPNLYIRKSEKKIADGIEVRVILPKGTHQDLLANVDEKLVGKVNVRVLEKVNMAVNVNDVFATIALPGTDGNIDRQAVLFGSDSKFRQWCKEVFEYYWERAEAL